MCASERRSAKKPVDSSTTSAPRSAHGRSAGSRCETTLSASPSTIMPSLGGLDDALVAAQHGVVLEQVRERGGVREVVDRDDVDVGAGFLRGAEEVAADAAEAVDADANGHALPSSVHAAAQRMRLGPCSILPRDPGLDVWESQESFAERRRPGEPMVAPVRNVTAGALQSARSTMRRRREATADLLSRGLAASPSSASVASGSRRRSSATVRSSGGSASGPPTCSIASVCLAEAAAWRRRLPASALARRLASSRAHANTPSSSSRSSAPCAPSAASRPRIVSRLLA